MGYAYVRLSLGGRGGALKHAHTCPRVCSRVCARYMYMCACVCVDVCVSVERHTICVDAMSVCAKRWRMNTLQHNATHCNTLPRTATHCNAQYASM